MAPAAASLSAGALRKGPPDAATGSTICHRWSTGLEQLPAAGPGAGDRDMPQGQIPPAIPARLAQDPAEWEASPREREDRAKLCTQRPRAPDIKGRSRRRSPSAPPQREPSHTASLLSSLQREMPRVLSPTSSAHITLLPKGDFLPWPGCAEQPSPVASMGEARRRRHAAVPHRDGNATAAERGTPAAVRSLDGRNKSGGGCTRCCELGVRQPPLEATAGEDDSTRALGDCGPRCALAGRGSGHPPCARTRCHLSWWDLVSPSLVHGLQGSRGRQPPWG